MKVKEKEKGLDQEILIIMIKLQSKYIIMFIIYCLNIIW